MTVIAMNQNSAAPAERDKVDPGLAPKQNPTAGNRRAALPHVAIGSTVDANQTKPTTQDADRVERWVYRIVLFVMAVVPLLAFLFSFGNVGDLGKSLGVDWRIAYLTGPGVDLFVTGLNVAATWLSHRGRTEKELWPVHALSAFCGLIMFALNCGPAFYARRFELAGFNAVGPFLLIAMGLVGPWLLRQLADARQPAPTAGDAPAAEAAPARTAKPAPERHEPATPAERTAPGTAQPPAERTAPEPARTPGTDPGMPPKPVPAPEPPAPERAKPDAGTAKPAGTGTRVPFEVWLDRAIPLFESYAEKHGEHPTAAVLAAHLRNAFPDPNMPGSDRWERKLNSEVKKHLGFDEESETSGVVTQ
jgi:hypothetical protein